MSVAFTKEHSAETASEILLPDRPVSLHPNLVTEAGLKALEFQLHQSREAYEAAQKIEDVSFVSPVARLLMGKAVGDEVGPSGQNLEIISIS